MLEEHTSSVPFLKFFKCGKKLISGSLDDTIIIWDLENKTKLSKTELNKKLICFDISDDEGHVATGLEDFLVIYDT